MWDKPKHDVQYRKEYRKITMKQSIWFDSESAIFVIVREKKIGKNKRQGERYRYLFVCLIEGKKLYV